MWKIAVCFVALAAVCLGATIDCTRVANEADWAANPGADQGSPIQDQAAMKPTECLKTLTKKAKEWEPYCLATNRDDPNAAIDNYQYKCHQCLTDCDCGFEEYCQNTDTRIAGYGTCKSFKDKLGKPCNPTFDLSDARSTTDNGWSSSTPENRMAVYPGHGNDGGCFISEKYTDAGQDPATRYVVTWVGSCVQGTCRACNSWGSYRSKFANFESGGYSSEFRNMPRQQVLRCISRRDHQYRESYGQETQARRLGLSPMNQGPSGPAANSLSGTGFSYTAGYGSPRACYNHKWVVAGSSALRPFLLLVALCGALLAMLF